VADENGTYTGGPAPADTEVYPQDSVNGRPILLKREVILTGERVQNAQPAFDQNNSPMVAITLDSAGGTRLNKVTRTAVGKRMAALFIENKQKITYTTDPATGKSIEVRTPYTEKFVINSATIQSVLSSQFQITGIGSQAETADLALMLRAGALAAPMYFVEERTVGPSLGQANIDKGILSTQVGFGLVALFMLVFYRLFGLIANFALFMNLALILAIMSALGAALSLPGIAGIVLTIGIAVDANVLICERIREEIRHGAKPVTAIVLGYDRAFSTIIDAHVTTLIVAIILFAVGTGPIKGFAVTLSIGIICSLFTAITVTRGVVQIIYGNRHVEKLSI
jgi:preprotein translocase subunit SecD